MFKSNNLIASFAMLFLISSCGSENDSTAPDENKRGSGNGVPTEPAPEPKKKPKPSANNDDQTNTNNNPDTATTPDTPEPIFDAKGTYTSENKSFTLKLDWLKKPGVSELEHLRITFANRDRTLPEKVEAVKFLPFMTIHGHPGATRRQTVTSENQDNTYIVQGFSFTMSGPWDLIVTATINGKQDKLVIPVEVP